MKAVRIVGLVLLSFLLFVSLCAFGVAFAVDRTVLNQGFIPAQVDRLDIASLVEETAAQADPDDLPADIRAAVVSAVRALEPEIKIRCRQANARLYDYLLGRTGDVHLASVLKETVLDRTFIASAIDQAGIQGLARKSLRDQLVEIVPPDQQQLVGYLDEAMPSLDPWLREQVNLAAGPVVDYLLGESQNLNLTLPLDGMKATLRANVRQAFLRDPPAALAGATPAQLEAVFNEGYNRFAAGIGATATIDQTTIGVGSPDSVALAFSDAEAGLARARAAISRFRTGYILLAVFTLLLVAGIALLHGRVKGAALNLGIVFLVYGAVQYAGVLVGRYFISSALSLPDTPEALRSWMPGLIAGLFRPLEMLSLSLAIAGLVMVVVSAVLRGSGSPAQPLSPHNQG